MTAHRIDTHHHHYPKVYLSKVGEVLRRTRKRTSAIVHRRAKDVAERVRRIGGQQEHAPIRIRAREPQRHRRRARRLADAAFSSEE